MADRPVSETGDAVEAPAAPGWFRKPKARSAPPKPAKPKIDRAKKAAPAAPVVALGEGDEDFDDRTPGEKFADWFADGGGMGLGAAIVVHAVLMLVLWAIFLGANDDTTDLGMLSDNVAANDDIDMTEVENLEVEIPQMQPEQPAEPEVKAPEVQVLDPFGDIAATASKNPFAGMEKLSFKPGANAVRKGNFMAWTVPKDPAPGQNYQIHIVIKVPRAVRQYNPSEDLTGSMVIGTDLYRQNVAFSVRGFLLKPERGFVKLPPILVPGAARLVKDTIKLQSKRLKKKETLEIVF